MKGDATVIKNLNDGENCEFEPKSGYDTETTVAADLIAPRKGYLELDAHPPMIIP